jgi:predicted 2-oxoglutarate/Fe(II)-dependent dioxygenase YbiX
LYPSEIGMLEPHSDGHGDLPIIHFMVPLSFKKIDYENGGLYLYDKYKNRVDIDELVEPGDVIFFDGRNIHGVDKVIGGTFGRLAIFAIPTFFVKGGVYELFFRSLKITLKEVISKLHLIPLLRRIKNFS